MTLGVTQIAMSAIELVGLSAFFWRKTGEVYKAEHRDETESTGAGTREALKNKVTWLCALFFFSYMGVEGELCFLGAKKMRH